MGRGAGALEPHGRDSDQGAGMRGAPARVVRLDGRLRGREERPVLPRGLARRRAVHAVTAVDASAGTRRATRSRLLVLAIVGGLTAGVTIAALRVNPFGIVVYADGSEALMD